MIIELQATATGTVDHNSISLEWAHANTVGLTDDVLLVFVATVDDGRPNVASGTYGAEDLTLIAETKGAGGNSFPAGYIFGLENPSIASGIIAVGFDESVVTLGGFSALFTGIDTVAGTLTLGASAVPLNTPYPDYEIEHAYTSSTSGVVVDLCVSESSNHNTHIPGPDQVKIAEVELQGPKFTTTYRMVNTGTETVTLYRGDCGGPFAAVTLTIAELKGV